MAARKKKKKKAAARRRAPARKAPALNVVVGSKVKESVKSHGIRCSGDLVEAFDTGWCFLERGCLTFSSARHFFECHGVISFLFALRAMTTTCSS